MYKIKIKQDSGNQNLKIYDQYDTEKAKIILSDNGYFHIDSTLLEEAVEWIFENTEHRFVCIGSDTFLFEDENDAAAFKLRWL